MTSRKLSLALVIVLLGSCLIAPPNVFGGNPWDPDEPEGGVTVIIPSDTTQTVIESPNPADSSDVSLTGEPVQEPSPSWMPDWLYQLILIMYNTTMSIR